MIRENAFIYLGVDELAKKLSALTQEKCENVKNNILNLIRQGVLFLQDDKVSIAADHGYIKGKLSLNRKGYGFVSVPDKPDFFIPAFAINGAMDGDDVLFEITRVSDDDLMEGKIVRVLTRNTTHIVGTYIVGKSKNVVFPDDDKIQQIRIYKGDEGTAQNNEKVWVELDSALLEQGVLCGKIIEVLGKANSPKAEQLSIIRSYKLVDKFDAATVAEAKRLPQRVEVDKFKNRQDFTSLKTITIDGEDARDFDDAISVEENAVGGYTLYVHIADVSHYVTENSALDKEAYKRGTSVYFPNQVIPMLPVELSNGICSLNEGENRLTLSVVMEMDENANVLSSRVVESVIKSAHRMTYTEITNLLAGDELLREKYADVLENIFIYREISRKLKEMRLKRGEIRFNIPEPFILENEQGEIISITKRMQDEAHEIIESLMIAANEAVARWGYNTKLPLMYRVHEKPDQEKVMRLSNILSHMGVSNNLEIEGDKPAAYQRIMEKIEGSPKEQTLAVLTLRTMMKARYCPTCLGHFGLASEYYCHFTSPIRRYPDLMVHRVIKCYLNGMPASEIRERFAPFVERACERCSETEKTADEAERAVDDYKKAVYMKNFLGQEFDATISGVQEFGIFAELENGVEGMIKADNLPFDTYEYDDMSLSLKGKQHSFVIGDKLRIVVSNVNTQLRQIDFDLVGVEHQVKDFINNKTFNRGKNLKQDKNNKNSSKNAKNNKKSHQNQSKNKNSAKFSAKDYYKLKSKSKHKQGR